MPANSACGCFGACDWKYLTWVTFSIIEHVRLFQISLALHMVPICLEWPSILVHSLSFYFFFFFKSQLISHPSTMPPSALRVESILLSCVLPECCIHTFPVAFTRLCLACVSVENTLFNVHLIWFDSLTSNSQPVALQLMLKWSCLTCVFSIKHTTPLHALERYVQGPF